MREALYYTEPSGREVLVGFWSPGKRTWERPGIHRDHLMRVFGETPGIQLAVLDRLEKLGMQTFVAWQSKGRKWTASIHTLRRNGVIHDFGHGSQLFMPGEFWKVDEFEGSARSNRATASNGGGPRKPRRRTRSESVRGARVPRPVLAGAR